ncbi:MAG TPA: acyl-CoA dehydrogenase family protein [Acidimicrobiales bacterium]|nr:acyl-CoA dehydrogenase family protein [Acidimicrobiales bacterium]
MDATERDLFAGSVRAAMESPDVDGALVDLGWRDALADDVRAAVSVVFDVQGRANAASSALDDVLLDALGIDTRAAVVLPPLASWRATSTAGVTTRALSTRSDAVVLSARDDKYVAHIVPATNLVARPISGIDPTLGLLAVELSDESRPIPREMPDSSGQQVDWDAALAAGQRALAHELVGAARTMLDLAQEHALGREQFGRPIAQFQAVRHRLAETFVYVEAADALVGEAWDEGGAESARMAKAFAGRAARTAARHCQQVLAGIGFTTEHPFHRYLARVLVLDQLLGSGRALTRELGRDVLRRRALPPLVDL